LAFELGDCRPAQVAVIVTAMLWVVGLAIDYGWFPAVPAQQSTIAAIGCRFLGQITLLLGIGIYARHVLLDAEGLLKQPPAKPRREKPKKVKVEKQSAAASTATNASAKESRRIDPPHKPAVPSSQQATSAWSANHPAQNRSATRDDDEDDDSNRYEKRQRNYASYGDDEHDDDSDGDNRKLSKAERKRLRKQLRRQQRDEDRI